MQSPLNIKDGKVDSNNTNKLESKSPYFILKRSFV